MENTLFNKFILYIIYCHRNNIFTIIDPEREDLGINIGLVDYKYNIPKERILNDPNKNKIHDLTTENIRDSLFSQNIIMEIKTYEILRTEFSV